MDDAINVMLQNGWLVQLDVVMIEAPVSCCLSSSSSEATGDGNISAEDDAPRSAFRTLTLFEFPDTTVSSVKKSIAKRWGIPEKDQVLSVYQKPLLFGSLYDSVHPAGDPVTVKLKQISLDPRLQSLYDMVGFGFGDWEKRDEIMRRIYSELMELETGSEDPYAALESFARDFAKHFANANSDGNFSLRGDKKILHDGVQLIIRFEPVTREVLVALELDANERFLQRNFLQRNFLQRLCCGRRRRRRRRKRSSRADELGNARADELRNAMKNAEIDRYMEHGATAQMMSDLRSAWKRPPHELFPMLASLGGMVATRTSIVSYDLDKVIYEVDLRADYRLLLTK